MRPNTETSHLCLLGRSSALALALMGLAACAAHGPVPQPFPKPSRGVAAPAPPPSNTVSESPTPEAEPVPPAATTNETTTGDDVAAPILQTALTLIGTRYRTGGGSPETGFDCSGFVNWVFGQHGISVPRTVSELFRWGWSVVIDEAVAAGDLLFFDTEGGPSHVAIALGDGRFVHAPNARSAVRIDTLTMPYWARRYLGARRVVEDRVGTGSQSN
ncbi:MAG: C40 family peptidase [Vicinamibacterales bacterium]